MNRPRFFSRPDIRTTLGLLALFLLGGTAPVIAHDLSGFMTVEGRLFANRPLAADQKKDNAALVLQPEYYHDWENGLRLTMSPFLRLDSADSQRNHFDIRELNILWPAENWEVRAGIGKIFWGATEFVHLVDIINQTDGIEGIDGEDKLGQPMVKLSLPRDWGTMDFFVLPGFRERTFPGNKGRLRTGLTVDVDRAAYENAAAENHWDFAARYSHSIAGLDFGISHFRGIDREPQLLTGLNNSGQPILIPYYVRTNQTGLDLQLATGRWLWKFEGLHRTGQGDDFFAGTGGLEYTLFDIFERGYDLGIIGELVRDSRGELATTAMENDVMFGLRLALNNAASTEILIGLAQDLDSAARIITLEAGHRLTDNLKLHIEAGLFLDAPIDDLLYNLRDDDYLKLEMAWYF